MPTMVSLLFKAIGPKTLRSFDQRCRSPRQTQEDLLKFILSKNQGCAFGKTHGFDKIKSPGDFKSQVPICDYQDLEPYINAQLNGKAQQLTSDSPVFFATTSGTTGKPKHIPVTPDSKSAKSQLLRVWFAQLAKDHPAIFDGKTLAVVSPEVESLSSGGIPCGAESGHGYRTMPKSMASAYAAPYEIYAIEDYDAKYYTLLRLAAEKNITFIYTVNPSTVLLLAQRLNQYRDDIVKDIRDGTLSNKYKIPDDIRKQLAEKIKPNAKRAKPLENAIKQGNGFLLPKYAWPNLAAIGCWKGGSVGMYISKFPQYFQENIAIRDVGYYASEHRGSVPVTNEDSSGVLAIPTNVYEFFPVREDREPDGKDLLCAHELEKGQQYYIYVTTHSGLYRYDMNDIIEVTGFYKETPLIRFVQKGKGVVSFTGEKLYEAQVIAAVEKALDPICGRYEFIAAIGKIINDVPQYVFLTEFDNSVSQEEGKNFANRIEDELSNLNIEYASKRKSNRIDPLVLRVVKSGEFAQYRKRKVEGGKADGQFKILKLTKDEDFEKEFQTQMDIPAAA